MSKKLSQKNIDIFKDIWNLTKTLEKEGVVEDDDPEMSEQIESLVDTL